MVAEGPAQKRINSLGNRGSDITGSESPDEEYLCDVCNEPFPTEEAMDRHVHEEGLVN